MQIDRPIAIALIIFVIILLVFFLVMPEYNTFGQLQVQLGEKKAEFNAENDYYAAIARTYADLQARQDDIAKIDDSLPQGPSLGKLVYYLQQTATANGLIVKDLFLSKSSPASGQATTSDNVKDIIFSMDLLGDYPSLERFMVALENSSRIFEITNISFGSSSNTQSGQSQFQSQSTQNFNLQIKTHSY